MKLHQRLFQLFVLLLPTQLAYHFWPDFAFVNGLRIDYLAPTLFATDILFAVFLVLWLLEKKDILLWRKFSIFSFQFLIIVYMLVNIIASLYPLSTFLHWLRIVQAVLLYKYVDDQIKIKNLLINKLITTPLALGIIIIFLIALGQLVTGRNIGGLLYWLGERPLSINQPGVALINYFGQSILRPYSTFPHPNVLAGYAGLLFLLFHKYSTVNKNNLLRFTKYILLTIVLLSFSQAAWLALVVALILMKIKNSSIRMLFTASVILSLFSPVIFNALPIDQFLTTESIIRRVELSQIAGKAMAAYPLFGTGLGQFIRTIPHFTSQSVWWLQPVHNIPLLIVSETGLIGLLIFFGLIFKLLKANNYKLKIAFLFVLITGMVDHYWLTIHQTLLLLPIVFATIRNDDSLR